MPAASSALVLLLLLRMAGESLDHRALELHYLEPIALRALKLSALVVIAMPDKRSVFVSRPLSGDKSRSSSPIRRAIRSGRSVANSSGALNS
jgi:hypothetical protein